MFNYTEWLPLATHLAYDRPKWCASSQTAIFVHILGQKKPQVGFQRDDIQNHVLPELQINSFWGPDLKLWRSIVQQLHHHEKWEHHAHQDGAPVLENHTLWMMDLLYRVVVLRKTTKLPTVTYPIEYYNQNLKCYSIAHYWVWVPCFYYIQRLQYSIA